MQGKLRVCSRGDRFQYYRRDDPTDFNGSYITQAEYCFKMKKLYSVDLPYEPLSDEIKDRYYPNGDMHRMYVCEIKQFLVKE